MTALPPRFPRRTVRLALPALAALTLAAALPAHAIGRLIDVDVIDRDSGATLPIYRHGGDHWVAGRPGARYAIQVRNATRGRVMGVMSVDGVNILSGDTAAWHQAGYVLSPWQSYQVTGWRKSDSEVAQFHFTALPKSYAARTGRPGNVGVLGVAVFREKAAPPPPPPVYRQRHQSAAPAAGEAASAHARDDVSTPVPAAPAAESKAAAEADQSGRARGRVAPQTTPRLGTGHGERESSWVTNTQFQRRASQPDEVITLRYDSHENLVAMGIIPVADPAPRSPDAFPESPVRYVPDPPAWR